MSEVLLPFVEGQSEVKAIRVLLLRLLDRLGRPDVQIARPFRVSRLQVVRPTELERALVQGLRDRGNVSAVLVLLDSDDEDPHALESALRDRCRQVTDLPTAVVAAQRELEAWFLGCKDALRGFRGIRADANAPPDPETIRGAKERLTRNMEGGRRYVEVDDQPAFAARMDLDLALQRCASFQRFELAIRRLFER